MGKLRTSQQLLEYLKKDKEKRLRIKQEKQNKIRQLKALERLKKQQHKQFQAKLKKEEEKQKEQQKTHIKRTIIIYHTKYIERFSNDEDLYNTKEELMEAEKRGEGKINWKSWDYLIQKTKQNIKEILNTL